LDQFLHRSRYVFDRHVRIDTVLIKQIDDIDFKPLERGLGYLLDVLRPTVQARRSPLHSPRIDAGIETELGGNHHPIAKRRERLTDEFLVDERAIDLRSVEEGYAAFHGCPEKRNHLLLVLGRTVRKTHSHAAEPERRNFQ